MRISLAVILSILCDAALAQASTQNIDRFSSLTDNEVAIEWEKLMVVTSGETEGAALAHLGEHGMSKDGAKALTDFSNRAELEMSALFDQFSAEVCGNQKEIRESGGPEMMAQMIEESRRRIANARRRLLTEANSALSLADQERLEHIFTSDHGPRGSLDYSRDAAVMVRNGQISVDQAISRQCRYYKK